MGVRHRPGVTKAPAPVIIHLPFGARNPGRTTPRTHLSMDPMPRMSSFCPSLFRPYALLRTGPLLALLLVTGPQVGVHGQEVTASTHPQGEDVCRDGVVGSIEVRNHSLFSPESIQGHRLEWGLSFVNWLHIRTRAEFIRDELLFAEGECFSEAALAESLRILRDFNFIARVEAREYRKADSTWAVSLETWDEWSTEVGVDIDVESNLQFKGGFIRERNFLGRGLGFSFRYRAFREKENKHVSLSTDRFLDTRANASITWGTTRTGKFFRQAISNPFVSESGRTAFESEFTREDLEFSFFTDDGSPISHLLLPLTDIQGRVSFGRRFGEPGALTVVGGEIGLLHREVAGPARQVFRRDFDGATTAPDSLAQRLSSQDSPSSHLRFGVTLGLRRLRFTTGTGLDRISGVQNVALGSELTFTVGRSLTTFGSSGHFSWLRFDGFLSGASGPLLANTNLRAEGRLLDRAETGEDSWRDLALESRTFFFFQPGASQFGTFFAKIEAHMKGNPDQPHQSSMGGEFGVRSYREEELPVGRTLVASLEYRTSHSWFHPVLDLGFTLFGDLGRGWAGGVPFGLDTGWRKAVGAGIRIGFPAGTGAVTHVEVAWPVGNGSLGRTPVFRTYWTPVHTSR